MPEIERNADGIVLCDCEGGERLAISARAIVNATGAWIDESARSIGATLPARLVSGTKGSHLVLDNPGLAAALGDHMIYYEHGDGRVCIVFPYLGRILAGSTDLRVNEAGRTACSSEERDYILGALQALFPDIAICAGQIVYSYAGIRPLPVSKADFTGRISRDHMVRHLQGPVPQIGMVGGKWTTYRAFAEETVDVVLKDLGLARKESTRDLPIGGGAGFHAGLEGELAAEFGIDAGRAAHLVDLYGGHAAAVAAFCAAGADRDLPGVRLSEAEVARFVRHEQARHLGDVLQRRSPLAIRGELSLPLVTATAQVMARECGWTAAVTESEIARFVQELETYHGVSLNQKQGAPK